MSDGTTIVGGPAPIGTASRLVPSPSDLAIAGCLLAISLLTAALAGDEPGATAPEVWWEWVVVASPSIAVAWRRTAPLASPPLVIIGQALTWALDLAEVFAAPLLAIYTLAAIGTRLHRRAAVAAALTLTATATVGVFRAPDVDVGILALTILSCGAALLLGTNVAGQRAEAAGLAADLAVARTERAAERERAVLDERARIARELHDLVGHSLSMIAVRAEAGERVAGKRPDAALETVRAIGETARSSLAEVRRVLSAVRTDDLVAPAATPPTATASPTTASPELAPVPGLAQLAELTERTAAASGRPVGLHIDPSLDPGEVDRTLGAGIYRIVQEALTNTVKHAGPAASPTVSVSEHSGVVTVEVADDGRGDPDHAAPRGVEWAAGRRPSGRVVEPSETTDRPGSGIAGMRERATVLGGTLEAGPSPAGGFLVVARLPLHGGAPGSPAATAVTAMDDHVR